MIGIRSTYCIKYFLYLYMLKIKRNCHVSGDPLIPRWVSGLYLLHMKAAYNSLGPGSIPGRLLFYENGVQ